MELFSHSWPTTSTQCMLGQPSSKSECFDVLVRHRSALIGSFVRPLETFTIIPELCCLKHHKITKDLKCFIVFQNLPAETLVYWSIRII